VNSINVIKGKDVNIAPDPDNPKALVMTLDYEERTNFVANVDLIVHFAKTYPVNLH
jgi:hypothetical protein